MSRTIPVIRAAAIFPMLIWLRRNGRPVNQRLAAADLAHLSLDDPMQVIPLYCAAALFREMARAEGPDIGLRVVTESSVAELALLGKVALGARTPREALTRVAAAMPWHCSHEHMRLTSQDGDLTVIDGWTVELDSETLHVIHQHVAALIAELGRLADGRPQVLERIEIVPHPLMGLTHLQPRFGDRVVAARNRALTVHMAAAVADRPFPQTARDRSGPATMAGLKPLHGTDGIAPAARDIIAAMLEGGQPTVERLAFAAGMSLRSLQRRLAAEGTSYSGLLEMVRREQALRRIAAGDASLGAVSANLGFARQSALTRAVRRWTGRPPSALRR